MPSLHETTRQLDDAVSATLAAPTHLPAHLLFRIGALLGTQTAAFVDSNIEISRERRCTGRIIVFTPTRVIVATAADAPVELNPGEPATYSVTVETWARNTLVSLAIAPDSTDGVNADDRWDEPPDDSWPRNTSLTLVYAGREPIRLPPAAHRVRDHARALAAFVPSLIDDVSSGSVRP